MSITALRSDPGIQVVSGYNGIEVDGQGIQHQPYDRDAPLEDTQAHFEANFQPDHQREQVTTETININPTPDNHDQEGINANENTEPLPSRLKLSARFQRGRKAFRNVPQWLGFALLWIGCGAIAASILAAHESHSRGPTGNGMPRSNCKSLVSPYTSVVLNTPFILDCDYNFFMSDLVSVWVYQFEDCINACVSFNLKQQGSRYNESCAGVTYNYHIAYNDTSNGYYAGNCFLKAVAPNSTGQNEIESYQGVDSAYYANLEILKH